MVLDLVHFPIDAIVVNLLLSGSANAKEELERAIADNRLLNYMHEPLIITTILEPLIAKQSSIS